MPRNPWGFAKLFPVAIIVPLVLGGLALAVMTIVSMLAARKKRLGSGQDTAQAKILIHAINDDRCTGCDACVAVCPTNVLDLIQNKSRVLRFQDCIQCEACMWACPTEALVMFPEGNHPPPIRVPEIDNNFQTAIPGQYLIGEVAGKPLVKNAANLGRSVVEHMLKTGIRPTPGTQDTVDVLIVGSGPGGMSAALSCIHHGLSYLVIEKENVISSTVSRYPKGKLVMAEPYETPNLSLLPVFDSTKEEMVQLWQSLAQNVQLRIKMHETVQIVQRQPDGSFVTATSGGQYRSQRVVLATGTRGKPRSLGVQGENLPKVESLLEDPARHVGQAVCVVGGGDSALEAALALTEAGAKVIMSYRGRTFHRAQAKNRQRIDEMAELGRIKIKMQSEISDFAPDTVTLQMSDGTQKRYPNQAAFVLIGADPPIQWLSTLGINYIERPHMQPMPASDQLVRQFVLDAQECPQTAEGATALVLRQALPQAQAAEAELSHNQAPLRLENTPAHKAGAARRFIRSATGLLGMGGNPVQAVRPQAPMSLSDFAVSAPTGSGRRDQLDAPERTRILRMLRDEGGRHADEDSQVYRMSQLLDSGVRPMPVARMPMAPMPKAPEVLTPSPQQSYQDVDSYQDPETPIPPPAHGHGVQAGQQSLLSTLPVQSNEETTAPKQALIVGVARARQATGRRLHAPEVHEERTESLSFEEGQELVQEMARRAQSQLRQPVIEEATQMLDFNPADIEHQGFSSLDSEATQALNVDDFLLESIVQAPDPLPLQDPQTPPVSEDGRSLSEVDWDID